MPTLDRSKEIDATLAPSDQARLRALDAMLGGVAHDLNNALSVVLMNLDVMQQDSALMSKHGRRMDGMLDAMTGASALVRHLLSFSHSRRPEPEVVSIAETMASLIELLQVAIGREVDIIFEPGDVGPCCAVIDQASFEVAVAHAALQLAEAMPGGGMITFDLAKGELPDDPIVLTIEAQARDSAACDPHGLDLELVAHFARDANGTMSSTVNGANNHRIAIHLPACAEATTF